MLDQKEKIKMNIMNFEFNKFKEMDLAKKENNSGTNSD